MWRKWIFPIWTFFEKFLLERLAIRTFFQRITRREIAIQRLKTALYLRMVFWSKIAYNSSKMIAKLSAGALIHLFQKRENKFFVPEEPKNSRGKHYFYPAAYSLASFVELVFWQLLRTILILCLLTVVIVFSRFFHFRVFIFCIFVLFWIFEETVPKMFLNFSKNFY